MSGEVGGASAALHSSGAQGCFRQVLLYEEWKELYTRLLDGSPGNNENKRPVVARLKYPLGT